MEKLKMEYPDPRIEQVELDENHVNAKMSTNPQKIGHYLGLIRANERGPQSRPQLKPLDIAEGFRKLERARAQIQSRPDTTQELRLASLLLANFEEAETSLVAQTEEDVPGRLTPDAQMALLILMEAEAKAERERDKSLLAQLPRDCSETRSFREQCDEAFAKSHYFARCRATLLSGGRLEDVEPDE
ncbi:uncharacterized protein N7487_002482 [Penicillium crustosum]|uniref:uncharacterized protein n=1 Tax=Penicillium crustosum TaxID=36656 RepID=UPI00239107ED|nr:uncharacterized protein N7487_002482 [Penicillium crustosum]KAJ5418932.1 hypothetical protein N7487_002482 [Penicillium crustosum]